jgi:WD40 repeat protein
MAMQPDVYKVGGSLGSNAPSYVMRQGDRDLYQFLKAGEFCYIFNSRQMGKSSLRLQAMQRLNAEAIRCVAIDMTEIGSQGVTAEQWYTGIALTLVTELDLDDPIAFLAGWWQQSPEITSVQRLAVFIETVLLPRVRSPIVIFIDEIDSLLSLQFPTDDFFALIRSCYEKRALKPDYHRLTFVLIGVATPSDLMQNRKRTPFNIGQAIQLHGFQLDEVAPLAAGLADRVKDAPAAIATVLQWTGGQPFLTQKVCRLIVQSGAQTPAEIVAVLQSQIMQNWESQDEPPHLKTIRDRILSREERTSRLLELYYRLLQAPDHQIPASESPEQQQLKLSGLVVEQQGYLQIYNPIYAAVFNAEWVNTALAKLRPYRSQLKAWVESDRQDGSRLLRGQALQEALSWARSRTLSGIETQFLQASQQEENTDLIRANRILKRAQKQAQRWIQIGVGILLATIIMAGVVSHNLHQEKVIAKFEQTSAEILGQLEFSTIPTLQLAIANAQKFQQFLQQDAFFGPKITDLTDYPTPQPLLALQKTVDNIQELNEINTDQRGINVVLFLKEKPRVEPEIVVAGVDGTVKIWNRQGQLLRQYDITSRSEQQTSVQSIRFSKDESWFVTGSQDGYVRLWQVDPDPQKQPQLRQEIRAHPTGVFNVRVSPDETKLITTGAKDGVLKLWELGDRRIPSLLWQKLAHPGGIVAVNFAANGTEIASGGKDGTAKLWNLLGAEQLLGDANFKAGRPQSAVNSVNFCAAPCAYKLVTGGNDGIVRFWDQQDRLMGTIATHVGQIRSIRFSPNKTLLAVASSQDPTALNGNSVQVWDLQTGKFLTAFKGHQGAIESMRFEAEDRLMTSGRDDSTIRIWHIPPLLSPHLNHQSTINSVRFSPDGQHFVTAGEDGTIRWWQSHGNQPQLLDVFAADRDRQFTSIRIHPKFPQVNLLAAGADDGKIRLLEVTADQKLRKIGQFATEQGRIESMDFNYQTGISRALWQKPGPPQANELWLLGTTGNDSTIKLWAIDVSQKRLSQAVRTYNRPVQTWSVRFSPNGEHLAGGGAQGQVLMMDLKSGKAQEFTVADQKTQRVLVSFNADSRSLIVVSSEGKLHRWNRSGQSIAAPVETYQAGIYSVSLSATNQSVVMAGSGGAVRLWDLQGRQVADFRGHWGLVRTVSLSQDGKWLLSGSDDGVPRIWPVTRQLTDLVTQGCQWLQQEYLRENHQRSQTCPA